MGDATQGWSSPRSVVDAMDELVDRVHLARRARMMLSAADALDRLVIDHQIRPALEGGIYLTDTELETEFGGCRTTYLRRRETLLRCLLAQPAA